MKRILTCAIVVSAEVTFAQGTFQNLNFESATLSPVPPGQFGGEVPLSAALPGWSASIGGSPLTQIGQNTQTLTAASINILGPSWDTINPGIIDGRYTVYLESLDYPGSVANASIYQSGTIPNGTESLQLLEATTGLSSPGAEFTVSFGGNVLSPVALSTGESESGQPYTLYGFDVSSYAGHYGELEITTVLSTGEGLSQIEFDDISFSVNPVPEPSPFLLTGIGGLAFAIWRRIRSK